MTMCLILCTSQVSVLPKRQDRLSCFLAQKDWTVLHSVEKKNSGTSKNKVTSPAIVFKIPEHCPKLWILKIFGRHINRRKVLST